MRSAARGARSAPEDDLVWGQLEVVGEDATNGDVHGDVAVALDGVGKRPRSRSLVPIKNREVARIHLELVDIDFPNVDWLW